MNRIYLIIVGLLVCTSGYGQELRSFKDAETQKYGYRDKQGNVVILAQYRYASDFSDGIARVNLDGNSFNIDESGKIVPYTSRKMEIIWENVLKSNMAQIRKYRSKFKRKFDPHQSFTINRPYIIIENLQPNDECEDMDFISYSEGDFDRTAVDGLKTVVIRYDFLFNSAYYGDMIDNNKVGSYAVCLVYFDLEKKKCIGSDAIPAPVLPDKMPSIYGRYVEKNKLRVDLKEVEEKVKSRLATSEK